jgi:hypothetical protein
MGGAWGSDKCVPSFGWEAWREIISRPRNWREYNIKMYITEIGSENVDSSNYSGRQMAGYCRHVNETLLHTNKNFVAIWVSLLVATQSWPISRKCSWKGWRKLRKSHITYLESWPRLESMISENGSYVRQIYLFFDNKQHTYTYSQQSFRWS